MSKFSPEHLLISSNFYSVQGEGKSIGTPSYFVRLSQCNLQCGMSMKFLNNLRKLGTENLADGELFKGDLEESGEASWTCDSTSQWAIRGENQTFQWLLDQWKEEGVYEGIKNGTIHIIWTGGEPTIKQHQESIFNFFQRWWNIEYYGTSFHEYNPYSEIETNGTVYIGEDLWSCLNQINCSPKLANSGMTEKQRIVPEAIKRVMEHDNYQFKFVISTEEDVKEIFRDYIEPFNIPLHKVCCMPGMDNQDDFFERTRFVLEMAKKYKFIGSCRLHIAAWDKTLNV